MSDNKSFPDKDNMEWPYAVNYGNAALVAAVELCKRVLELEERIKTLEAE